MKSPKDGNRGEQLTRDNAVSALSKILVSEADSLPAKDLLPRLLEALPLTQDFTECHYVYTNLIKLVNNEKELVTPHLKQILLLLAQALAFPEKRVEVRTKTEIGRFLRSLCQNKKIQELVATLPPPAQAEIKKCLE
jgi:2C-methyl-D-erythritol 2,4-cyclodiphosphate synthase